MAEPNTDLILINGVYALFRDNSEPHITISCAEAFLNDGRWVHSREDLEAACG